MFKSNSADITDVSLIGWRKGRGSWLSDDNKNN